MSLKVKLLYFEGKTKVSVVKLRWNQKRSTFGNRLLRLFFLLTGKNHHLKSKLETLDQAAKISKMTVSILCQLRIIVKHDMVYVVLESGQHLNSLFTVFYVFLNVIYMQTNQHRRKSRWV